MLWTGGPGAVRDDGDWGMFCTGAAGVDVVSRGAGAVETGAEMGAPGAVADAA